MARLGKVLFNGDSRKGGCACTLPTVGPVQRKRNGDIIKRAWQVILFSSLLQRKFSERALDFFPGCTLLDPKNLQSP